MEDSLATAHIREDRRAAIVAGIPTSYNPTLHLLIPSVLGLGTMIGAASRIHALRPLELIAVPITLIAALCFEWHAHKDILHRRMPGLSLLYERHELNHHVIYTDRDMAMRSRRELFLILMPAYAIVLVFLALVLPMAFVLERLLGTNVAMLVVVTSMFFFLSYEWMHLAYHLPVGHPIGRLPGIARLREHHRRHHTPRLMNRWNFNVTVPLFDWIHRSVWSPEREARARARRRRGRERAAASAST
jgi:hypothetical protein